MNYEKPFIRAQIFTVQDFLTDSSNDDELPPDPDEDHDVFPDAFGDALSSLDFDEVQGAFLYVGHNYFIAVTFDYSD